MDKDNEDEELTCTKCEDSGSVVCEDCDGYGYHDEDGHDICKTCNGSTERPCTEETCK